MKRKAAPSQEVEEEQNQKVKLPCSRRGTTSFNEFCSEYDLQVDQKQHFQHHCCFQTRQSKL